jgi:hypothetical protein
LGLTDHSTPAALLGGKFRKKGGLFFQAFSITIAVLYVHPSSLATLTVAHFPYKYLGGRPGFVQQGVSGGSMAPRIVSFVVLPPLIAYLVCCSPNMKG